MEIALLGDLHFGARNDREAIHDYYAKFYRDIFFETLDRKNIKTVIQLGDVFDRRTYLNYKTLDAARRDFFDQALARDIKLEVLVGNHDIYHRNTIGINSPRLLLASYPNINVHDTPGKLRRGMLSIDLIPWICESNRAEILDFIANSKSQFCCGHFQLEGFEMDRGNVCMEGMPRNLLSHYSMVFSGHFHHRSSAGNIHYIGSPGELTWADYEDTRGFAIFDTETRRLKFIDNPYKLHAIRTFDGDVETPASVAATDFEQYRNKIVRLIIQNKKDDDVYDQFRKRLESVSPIDIQTSESFAVDDTDEVFMEAADDNLTLINKYIDAVETSLDKDKLRTILADVYAKAQNVDDVRKIDAANL